MFAHRFSRRAALASALFVALGSTAIAAPGHGPYGHGPKGPGAHGGGIEHVIARMKGQLNLNTQQQAAFDNAVAAARTAREAGRAERDRVHAAMKAELATPAPDFAKVAALADEAQAKGQALRRQVRDQWLALYATFTPEQKLVVRDAWAKRVERAEQHRERMRERFGG